LAGNRRDLERSGPARIWWRLWAVRVEELLSVQVTNRLMTLARVVLDQIDAGDFDLAPSIRDQPLVLQLSCHVCDACSSHAHHLRQKFLGQWQLASGQIVHSDQPLAHAPFNTVHRVAGGGLLYLAEEELFVLHQQGEELRRGLRNSFDVVCVDDARRARHLHRDRMQ
jgi:hypothetical protein